jgi:rubrerythrin
MYPIFIEEATMHYNWSALAYMPSATVPQNPYGYSGDTFAPVQGPRQQLPMYEQNQMVLPPLPNEMPITMPIRMDLPPLPNEMPITMPNKMNLPPSPNEMPITMPNQVPSKIPAVDKSQEIYTYPQNLAGALKLIEEAVAGENEDRLFYQYLINTAPSEEDKEIIRGIRENEITHFGLFRQIYSQLTGKMLPVPEEATFEEPASYCEGIQRAIKGEQNAVVKYRKILFAMQNRVHINMLTEIISDEIRHGILYNYLYTKNGCRG